MYTKISSLLDIVANKLESKGLLKEAFELDRIADSLDRYDIFDTSIYTYRYAADIYRGMSSYELSQKSREDQGARLALLYRFKPNLISLFNRISPVPFNKAFTSGGYNNPDEVFLDLIDNISNAGGQFWPSFSDFIEKKKKTEDSVDTIDRLIGGIISKGKHFEWPVKDFIRDYKTKGYSRDIPYDHQGMLSKEVLTELSPQKVVDFINHTFTEDPIRKAAMYYMYPTMHNIDRLKNTGLNKDDINKLDHYLAGKGVAGKTQLNLLGHKDLSNLLNIDINKAFSLLNHIKNKIRSGVKDKKLKKEDFTSEFPERWQIGQKPVTDEVPFRKGANTLNDLFLNAMLRKYLG